MGFQYLPQGGEVGAVMGRLVRAQFVFAAEAVADADAGDTVAAGAEQVVHAVADHQAMLRCQAFAVEQMADQFVLVRARAVQLAAVDRLEVTVEGEVAGDLAGEHAGLAGRDVERVAASDQGFEQASGMPSNTRFS